MFEYLDVNQMKPQQVRLVVRLLLEVCSRHKMKAEIVEFLFDHVLEWEEMVLTDRLIPDEQLKYLFDVREVDICNSLLVLVQSSQLEDVLVEQAKKIVIVFDSYDMDTMEFLKRESEEVGKFKLSSYFSECLRKFRVPLPAPAWIGSSPKFELDKCETVEQFVDVLKKNMGNVQLNNTTIGQETGIPGDYVPNKRLIPTQTIFGVQSDGVLGYRGDVRTCMELFRRFGPASCEPENYGSCVRIEYDEEDRSEVAETMPCSMLTCHCHSRDEDDEPIDWFDGECIKCNAVLSSRRNAIRIPFKNGFYGCYCNHACARQGFKDIYSTEWFEENDLFKLLSQLVVIGLNKDAGSVSLDELPI
jgi:hypothetical protein